MPDLKDLEQTMRERGLEGDAVGDAAREANSLIHAGWQAQEAINAAVEPYEEDCGAENPE